MKKIVFLISVFAAIISFKAVAQTTSTVIPASAATVTTSKPADPDAAVAAVKEENIGTINPIKGVTNVIDKAKQTAEAIKQRNELVNTLLGNNKPTSLMFDDDENENVNRAVESYKTGQSFIMGGNEDKNIPTVSEVDKEKQKQEENAKSYVYLASILYNDKKNWAIWISGNKITSADNDSKKELYVKSITHDEVKMRWTISISKWKILSGKSDESLAPKINENGQIEINFTLKPNQTFVLNANQVVEGYLTPKSQNSGISPLATKAAIKETTVNNSPIATTTPVPETNIVAK